MLICNYTQTSGEPTRIQIDKTIAEILMYIPNNDLQNCNWWLKRLDTQLNEQTNQKKSQKMLIH